MTKEIVAIIASGSGVEPKDIVFKPKGERDGVKRWESEEGYEMFRFNVPGKSRSAGRRWFFNKPSEKAVLYYVKVDNDIPPIEGWKCQTNGKPPVPSFHYEYEGDEVSSGDVKESEVEVDSAAAEKAEAEKAAAEKA
ncbi:hypothetical protein WA588_002942, partial [Blastocystis sp. NMH]